MGNIWLKIKIWTKGIVIGVLVLYALLFLLSNSGQSVKLWYFFRREIETSMLVLILATFVSGVIATLLVRTTLKTVRQVRELRQRSRLERLEREQAAIRAKAAMLQTRTAAPERKTANDQPPAADQ